MEPALSEEEWQFRAKGFGRQAVCIDAKGEFEVIGWMCAAIVSRELLPAVAALSLYAIGFSLDDYNAILGAALRTSGRERDAALQAVSKLAVLMPPKDATTTKTNR